MAYGTDSLSYRLPIVQTAYRTDCLSYRLPIVQTAYTLLDTNLPLSNSTL